MDLTPDRKQQSLIQAISAGVGTGLVASTAEYSQIDDEKIREDQENDPVKKALALLHQGCFNLDINWKKTLRLDLFMTPSSLLIPVAAEEGADDEPAGEFSWHCKNGIVESIGKIKEEFCKVRGLKPIKIFVTGPPLSGKTYFGEKLASHYNVPLVNIKKLSKEITEKDHPLNEDLVEW